MNKRKIVLFLLATGLAMSLFGCTKKYKISCSDKKEWYGIKSSYKAGENVVLFYLVSATDATLTIVVDGQPVDYDFSPIPNDALGGLCYRIEFTMPDHDIEVRAVWTVDPNGA